MKRFSWRGGVAFGLAFLGAIAPGCSDQGLAPQVTMEGSIDTMPPFDRAVVAATSGDLAFIKTCVEADSRYVVAMDARERTLLHYAAASNQHGVVQYLLQNGAWASATDDEGYSPVDVAVQERASAAVVTLLREARDRELSGEQ